MAPTSPVKRVTRARAAAKSSTTEPASKKVGTTKVTKASATEATASSTRKAKAAQESEDELAAPVEAPTKKTTRTTKATPITTAAPRRRIKVTPLDAPAEPVSVPEPEPEKPKKKSTTRSKKAEEDVIPTVEATAPAKPRARSTKTTTATTKKTEPAGALATKTRGRPKKDVATEENTPAATELPRATRQTRARSASVASQQQHSDMIEVSAVSRAGGRKKVTFQDLPEDDKENEIVPAKKSTTKKSTPATGMRAKPVRKPTTATTKKTTATRSRAAKPSERVLTPKKVTQIPVPSLEESEDELNGQKSPVRDLTLSPKRNPNVASLLSPAKKLDFSQSLLTNSPLKIAKGASLLSPARRPTSPAKADTEDAAFFNSAVNSPARLLQSPKRGILDSSIFPASAIKAQRSPLKESLLQSPARRLFSPAKSKTPLSVHRDVQNDDTLEVEEVAVSSRFRASMSPQRQRVYKMSNEELADELAMSNEFDQSILKLTSPRKSPVKAAKPLAAVLDEEPPMQIIQNDAEETAKAVEELAAPEEMTVEVSEDVEETVEPAHMSLTATDESGEEDGTTEQRPRMQAPRLSQILFRTARLSDDDESSEDELAADQTPDRAPRLFRSSLTGATNTTSRLSQVQNNDYTPLAAQMSGWLAASPHKTPAKSAKKQANETGLFSPLASEHVAGEIQISRNNTPQQHRPSPAFKSSINSRPSLSGNLESPERSTFFSEQMASVNEGAAEEHVDEMDIFVDEQQMPVTEREVVAENEVLRAELDNEADLVMTSADEEEEDTVIIRAPEELTTDLVNTVNGSDTAMLDFQELAHEADVDAEQDNALASSGSVYGDENAPPKETLDFGLLEQATNARDETMNLDVVEQEVATSVDQTLNFEVLEQQVDCESMAKPTSTLSDTVMDEHTLNFQVLEQNALTQTPRAVQAAPRFTAADEPTWHFDMLEQTHTQASAVTSQMLADEQTLDLDVLEQQALQQTPTILPHNAALSPECSPEPTASPSRFLQTEADTVTPRPAVVGPRVVNTVVSKVPLKPEAGISPIKIVKKRSRSMSMSRQQSPPKRPQLTPLGKLAARSTSDPVLSPTRSLAAPSPAPSTPGQMSFAVDDFGDSTLDGIEMPDEDMTIDFSIQPMGPPASTKSAKNIRSAAPTPVRAPLQTVNKGVLHGAVVHVEVFTSEGVDTSHVYVELLTSLGARCVKDWRWNPRASVHGGDDLSAAGKPGITHVVYKDGGKRTLEKVREAKGEVLCVGCAWVLDCERNQEWVDESNYIVSTDIFPRGGSRRRKSMQPQALVNDNGNISTARSNTGRRSVSAEFMTNQMRDELVNTPARIYQPPSTDMHNDSLFGDSDISSTYNSPTTTMNVHHVATPTELIGWDPATSKTPAKAAGDDGMDTPYLMKQGGMVMNDMARDGGVMSAPPKQIGKGLFDRDSGKDAGEDKKMKLKLQEARRRTLGFKPVIGSPLGKF
ncbi:uncharacterized protein AB675_3522 [Cyphellophora attinorum]|uniref:BRCT domain-containing protein n=1 Tax=Cyphellophora attinorum TaxID=1664694 RepID=A0A0N1P025_9EURO|nr:uncharacterized protein AB675_3522 [Phialophora attinorum]KPI39696.1 hypothetical protein AB675_3522 [Phialophora attinorum]